MIQYIILSCKNKSIANILSRPGPFTKYLIHFPFGSSTRNFQNKLRTLIDIDDAGKEHFSYRPNKIDIETVIEFRLNLIYLVWYRSLSAFEQLWKAFTGIRTLSYRLPFVCSFLQYIPLHMRVGSVTFGVRNCRIFI